MLVMITFLISSCANNEPKKVKETKDTANVVGGDRDAHGCIGSAKYQ